MCDIYMASDVATLPGLTHVPATSLNQSQCVQPGHTAGSWESIQLGTKTTSEMGLYWTHPGWWNTATGVKYYAAQNQGKAELQLFGRSQESTCSS